MRKNVFLFTVLGLFVCTCNSSYAATPGVQTILDSWLSNLNDIAAAETDVQTTLKSWQSNLSDITVTKCPGHTESTAFVYMPACVGGDTKEPQKTTGWFATEVNENGAKFCIRGLTAARGDINSKTKFRVYEGNTCLWLCKQGFSGDGCDTAVSQNIAACNNIVLSKDEHKNWSAPTEKDHSPEKHMARIAHKEYDCDKQQFGYNTANKKSFHDVFLMITDYDSNGNGAYVQDVVFRSWCKKGSKLCRTIAKTNGWMKRELLCKVGYTHSSDGQSCVPINEDRCKSMSDCEGWTVQDRTNNDFIRYLPEGGTCMAYKCAGNQKGFREGTRTCIDCTSTSDVIRILDGPYCKEYNADSNSTNVDTPCSGWESFKDKPVYKAILKNGCNEYRCVDGGFTSTEDKTCVACGENQTVGTDGICVSIAETDCDGWESFKDKTDYKVVPNNVCNEYRCVDGGFKSKTDKTCISCESADADGVCITNNTATTSGTTKAWPGSRFSKSVLANSKETSTGLPCWQVCETAECYKTCIKTGNKN